MSETGILNKLSGNAISFFDNEKNGERLYLVALIFYMLAGFSDSTMFDRWLVLVKFFKYSPLLFLLIKFVFFDKYSIKEFLLRSLIMIVGSIVMFKSGSEGNRAMYCCYFLAMAKNVEFEKIIRFFVIVNVGYIFVTLFASNYDMIRNLVYREPYSGKYFTRYSFGFVYPTDAAAHFLYLTMAVFYLLRSKMKWYMSVLMILLQIPVFLMSHTRATTYSVILFGSAFMLLRWHDLINKKKIKSVYHESYVPVIFRWSMPICAVIMTILTLTYDSENRLMVKLNEWLSKRLALGKMGIDDHGISLLGNNVEFIGSGRVLVRPDGYNFVDCSYLYSAIKYGIIFLLILIGAYVYACYKYKHDAYYILCVMIIAVHSMVEHHLMDVAYIPFLLAAATDGSRNISEDGILSERSII